MFLTYFNAAHAAVLVWFLFVCVAMLAFGLYLQHALA